MTTKEKRTVLNYMKLCFPLCGTNTQRMDELSNLIEKLKREIKEEEEQEEYWTWAKEQEENNS